MKAHLLRIAVPSVFVFTLLASAPAVFAQAKPIWRTPSVTSVVPVVKITGMIGSSTTQVAAAGQFVVSSLIPGHMVLIHDGSMPQAEAAMSASTSLPCPIVTTFMKIDGRNDAAEVRKLQAFLSSQGYDVAVSGIFDTKTEDAVKAFQLAHMSETMTPWGATRASGMVYLTTGRVINKIACGTAGSLTSSDMDTIQSYASATVAAEADMASAPAAEPKVIVLGSSATTSANTAAAGDVSFYARFKNFIKKIFSR